MAKVGPKTQTYDPFPKDGQSGGSPAFPALEQALESMESPPDGGANPKDPEDGAVAAPPAPLRQQPAPSPANKRPPDRQPAKPAEEEAGGAEDGEARQFEAAAVPAPPRSQQPPLSPANKRAPDRRRAKQAEEEAGETEDGEERPIATPRLDLTKRVKTTRDEARQFEAAATRLAGALEISVDFSKITRALWEVYLKHEPDILRNVETVGEDWSRPSNQDAAKLAALDTQLAGLINDGFMVACRRPSSSSSKKR